MEDATHAAPEIRALADAFAAIDSDARSLVAGLSEADGGWRATASTWSVAECLDHLAHANRVYLAAMEPAASRALASGSHRRRPALPGLFGRWFVRAMEPPPRVKSRAPGSIQPRTAPALADAMASFFASHEEVRRFLGAYAAIDLAGVRFPNPFVRGVRFSLATGLHVIAAHERRHLWQARRVREAAAHSIPFTRAS
ncbi:MAG TPA: DinB family protein [Vicinamibacterales bacterium]|nr:DinB family protein [Vicinamibacterales bacterium]